ncbi:hypothetical protein sscle_06g053930 [Sclerotinia sclerotiorum 1980 UF-70]|uniref:Zn(2)-C6 fungal-type domain-containing protein n=2 Tax=Sclerotinia sclerotiorum (strain ATCC 18683 / 1980 / Ss-1) TaxID=665079 RepID=A0A1D9Q7P9_SCLS1|nr:hypothetical protein sscle_06g053930 [Sclerotinia sclerotiorum 1980 UF-70]
MSAETPNQIRPRRRRCGPKVRTGCQTCKIRRVKCDEAKPSCERCVSTGRKCDGYITDLKRLSPEVQSTSDIQRLPTFLLGSVEERRSFQYFVSNTAAELSGYFDTSFWEHLILQASVADPSLRHAIIGLGALHEDFSNRKLDLATKCDAARSSFGFATNQYTKAISHLRRSLAGGKQKPLTAMMSCILFVCFDSLRGHFSSAIMHLQSGLKILHSSRSRSNSQDEDMIEENIGPMFKRLCIQAILYIDTRETSERMAFAKVISTISSRENTIPSEFKNLDAARRTLLQASDNLFRGAYMWDDDLPPTCQPKELMDLYVQSRSQLDAWKVSFENFMKSKSHTFNSKQLRGAALCKLHYTTVHIIARVSAPDLDDPRILRNSCNDPKKSAMFEPEFQVVVSLARSLINAAEEDAKAGKPPFTFSTDLGLIAPLYYTCIKSPSESTRRQALELLLQCPRKEGMWDSSSTVNLVRGFWNLEEQLMYRPTEVYPVSERLVQMSEVVNLIFNEDMKWEWKLSGKLRGEPMQCVDRDELSNLENLSWLSVDTMDDMGLFEMAGDSPSLGFDWP